MASTPKSAKPAQGSAGQRSKSSTTAGSSNSEADDTISFRLLNEGDDPLANPHLVENVPSRDPRYRAVAACIKLAFALLRVDDAQCLTEMGKEAVKDLDSRFALFHQSASKMSDWTMAWWCRLNMEFVKVQLNNSKPCLGWFEPSSKWAARGRDRWQPSDAGVMFLNKFAIESMVMAKAGNTAAHREAYDRFLLLFGIAIARGMVTCFLRTLVRPEVPIEGPKGLDPGCIWEYRVLGGFIKNLEAPCHALRDRQAGMLWLETSGRARQVKAPSFGGIIPNVFQLPLDFVGEAVAAGDLSYQQHLEMEHVREKANPRARSPKVVLKLGEHKKAAPAQSHSAGHHHSSNVSGGGSTSSSTGNSTKPQAGPNTAAAPAATGRTLRQLATARYKSPSDNNTGQPNGRPKLAGNPAGL
ncbi:uncharacterized protein B0T15DRAFT_41460 [Chaetomium strumarium]|uniref:Uncharacterized protein n=1 Tax=Chaetomium strumarium TaxID=1170767 RepID=A0AAJ0H2B0_9PEZI|nr:hypothetical protein B0T15DRAFT_41460 [Chaetomium strumarium]